MKEITTTQILVITDADPDSFQQKVNAALQEHPEINKIDYTGSTPGRYSVIITYTERSEQAETIEDIYQQEGKRYICGDCPHLEIDPDRRSRTHYCNLHHDRAGMDQKACLEFLEALRKGADHLVTTEERREQRDRLEAEYLEQMRKRKNLIQQIAWHKRNLLKLEQKEKGNFSEK